MRSAFDSPMASLEQILYTTLKKSEVVQFSKQPVYASFLIFLDYMRFKRTVFFFGPKLF